jgi:hypothetical protein
MKIERSIRLIGSDKQETATVVYEPADRPCRLVLRYRDISLEESAPDFFEAFCRLRSQLDKKGLQPLCYGASLNVYPSRMARDMGAGLKAYRVNIGQQARRTDLVDTFEYGPDVIPATVEQQKDFWQAWLKSLES